MSRKIFIPITLVLIPMLLSILGTSQVAAQTQSIIVKTKGRMVNGKNVRGPGLPGASVVIKDDNTYSVQNRDGSISIPVPSSRIYVVKKVVKNDYQLVDPDAVGKSYHYSKNPLYLVMEKPEQQAQDLLDSERNIRRSLENELKRREDELDSLRTAHKITLEEYQEARQKLYAAQANNEKLIAQMAKEYAMMDYDQMTDLNGRIHDAISHGRLTEADSLIRSKGDMKSRIEAVKREQQIEAEREKEIQDEIDENDKAKAGTQRKVEDIEEDCITLRKRFMLELQIDSAVYYVEQLLNLDSSNVRYLGGAGKFYQDICLYDKAEEYYNKALDICRRSPEDYAYEICGIQTNLALIYKEVYKNYSKAEELFKDYIEIIKRNGGVVYSKFDNERSLDEYTGILNLAGLYSEMKRFSEAESLYLKAINLIKNDYFKYDEGLKQEIIAYTYCALGINYAYGEKYEKAEETIGKAIEIAREEALTDSSYYKEIADYLSFSALFCQAQAKHEKSEDLYREAIMAYNNYETFSNDNQELQIAQIWRNLAGVYQATQRPVKSEKLLQDAIRVYQRYAQAMPEKYNKELSKMTEGLVSLYREQYQKHPGDYKERYVSTAEIVLPDMIRAGRFEDAETIATEVLSIDPSRQEIFSSLAAAQLFLGKYEEAEMIYKSFKIDLKDRFLKDLDAFTMAKTFPIERLDDVKKIKKILNE